MRSAAIATLLAITMSMPFEAKAQSAHTAAAVNYPVFPVVQGKVYKFQKVADGVYYVTGGVGGNSAVIVNERDVLLVDDGNTPTAARLLLQDLTLITDKRAAVGVLPSSTNNTSRSYDDCTVASH